MNPIELVENAPPIEISLPDGVGVALAESGVVTAVPTRRTGRWHVGAGRRVGSVVVDGVEVRIRPKLPVPRLMFLLGHARDPYVWRAKDVEFSHVDDLVAAVAHGFARQAERALRRGVLHGYVEREEALATIRGRLLTGDQLARRHGLSLPVEVRYDDFVSDIAENRLLRTAAQVLPGLPRVPWALAGRLRRFAARLDGARTLGPREPRPQWRQTRLNARYVPALRLAELVLDGASIEHGAGPVGHSGFLVDMWRVFEDFVGVALKEALAPHGGSLELQDTREHLDVASRVRLRPDMVWRRQGTAIAVVDAKYKVETAGGVPDSDLYQMLAYCTALGLRRGHLFYAAGQGPVQEHEVRGAGIVIECHALDLEQEPEDLLGEIAALAARLAESVGAELRD